VPTSSELRARARDSLRGNWTTAVLHFLLSLGVLLLIPVLGTVAYYLLLGPLVYGLSNFYLRISRNAGASTEELFSGFRRFVPSFVLFLLILIFVTLWSLLLIIPGIIAYYRYSQAFFILRDNPQIGALEAIRRSKELMVGNKGRLFVLNLSFIGWFLLTIPTLGIGMLWVGPYQYTALGHFHNDLLSRSVAFSNTPPPPPPPSPYM